MISFTTILSESKGRLELRTKQFISNPSSTNWAAMQDAMLLWQQVDSLRPVKLAEWRQHKTKELVIAMQDKPHNEWTDIACQVACGVSAQEALTT